MNLKDKQLKSLTIEEKQEILTCIYIYWIEDDFEQGRCEFLASLIKGEGLLQLSLPDNADMIELEFQCMLPENMPSSYANDAILEMTVEHVLEECNYSGAMDYFDEEEE